MKLSITSVKYLTKRDHYMMGQKQAFSQKGVQASWDGLQRKMDAFGRPNPVEREIILNAFLKYINISETKLQNSFNFQYYYTLDGVPGRIAAQISQSQGCLKNLE